MSTVPALPVPEHSVTNFTSTDEAAAVNVNEYALAGYVPSVIADPQVVPAQICSVQIVLPLANALIVYDAPEQTDIVWSIVAALPFVMVQSLCHAFQLLCQGWEVRDQLTSYECRRGDHQFRFHRYLGQEWISMSEGK